MCNSEMIDASPFSHDGNRTVEDRADLHVRRLQGFYAHLAAYVGVNAVLVVINLFTSPGVFWAIWPILGWGVKLGAHAVAVFGWSGIDDWKARARRTYIRRHSEAGPAHFEDTSAEPPEDEKERLRRRVENLEAIVTSVDWDLLADLDDDAPVEERTATLADQVVPK